MFVPVSCTACGKPFQVPESALGKLAPCPWCGAVVTALPVSASVPVPEPQPAKPAAQEPAQQPLSLDAAESAPSAPKPKERKEKKERPTEKPADRPPARDSERAVARLEQQQQQAPPKANLGFLIPLFLSLTILVVGAGATVVALNYGSGRMSESGWTEFTPPDGSFSITLPGEPKEEPVEPNPAGSVTGGKRYTVRAWYSKTTAWVAYSDLDPKVVPKLVADTDRVIAAGILQAERERERLRLGGTITNEVMYRLDASVGVVLQFDTPRGKVAEWLVVIGTGPHPRVYSYGIESKDAGPETVIGKRLNNSFRVNN